MCHPNSFAKFILWHIWKLIYTAIIICTITTVVFAFFYWIGSIFDSYFPIKLRVHDSPVITTITFIMAGFLIVGAIFLTIMVVFGITACIQFADYEPWQQEELSSLNAERLEEGQEQISSLPISSLLRYLVTRIMFLIAAILAFIFYIAISIFLMRMACYSDATLCLEVQKDRGAAFLLSFLAQAAIGLVSYVILAFCTCYWKPVYEKYAQTVRDSDEHRAK